MEEAFDEDITEFLPVASVREHINSVDTLCVNPTNRNQVVTGSHDHTMRIWDMSTTKALHKLTGHEAGVWSVNISPNGKTIASGSPDTTIKFWDISSKSMVNSIKAHRRKVYCVKYNKEGDKLISSGADHCVHLWDLKKLTQPLKTFKMEGNIVTACAYLNNDQSIVSTSFDGEVYAWDIKTGECFSYCDLADIDMHSNSAFFVNSFKTEANTKCFLTGSEDKLVRKWSLNEYDKIEAEKLIIGHSNGVRFVITNQTDRYILSCCEDHSLRVWDMENDFKCLMILAGHHDFVVCADFIDDNTIVSGSWDQTFNVYKVTY